MLRIPALLSAILVVVSVGILHGLWTNRWALSSELEASADRLANVAMNLGEWEGGDLKVQDEDGAGIVGSLARKYKNQRTGSQVQVLLVCGRPGHIAIHTPDVCYQGAGYSIGSRTKFITKVKPDEFWVANFVKEGTDGGEMIRIFWSWNADGRWRAPEWDPRLVFAGRPALFKLYLVRRLSRPDEPVKKDPCVELMDLLLPELQKCLFPKSP